jgi:four helix bundle protein
VKDFRSLKVWQKSHKLTVLVYEITKSFPKEEIYGLTSQIRRSSASIPTNLAEGCGRGSDKDFKRFVQIAMGSASETEYLFLFCHELKMVSDENFNNFSEQIEETKKMLASLIKSLRG